MSKLVDFFFISGLEDSCSFDDDRQSFHTAVDDVPFEVEALRIPSRRASIVQTDNAISIGCQTNMETSNLEAVTPHAQKQSPIPVADLGRGDLARSTYAHIANLNKIGLLPGADIHAAEFLVETNADRLEAYHVRTNDPATVMRKPVVSVDEHSRPQRPRSTLWMPRQRSTRITRQPSTISCQSSILPESRSRPELENYAHCITSSELNKAYELNGPMSKRYAPNLLARYPLEDDAQRPQLPAYLPMFAFPDDIPIRAASERPKSTWHSFALTHGEGNLLHGTCLILWIPIHKSTARHLKTRCENWRRDNVDRAEQELEASLSGKLAEQQMTLSSLLPRLMSASAADRERLDEQIAQCEEKIDMYMELLKPAMKDGSLTSDKSFWMPRALGLLGSNRAHSPLWKAWLSILGTVYLDGELQHVPKGRSRLAPSVPLERYLINLFQEVPGVPTPRLSIGLTIRGCRLLAECEALYELPGSRSIDLYPLFRALSNDNIIRLVEAALLESRIIFLSRTVTMLAVAAAAITALIYPMKWQGIYIPVLPVRLLPYLDAPTPYIMGVLTSYGEIDMPEGDDVVICSLDDNSVRSSRRGALPHNISRKLTYCLLSSNPMHDRLEVPYSTPAYCQEAFPASMLSVPQETKVNNGMLADLMAANTETFAATPNFNVDKPCLNTFTQTSRGPLKSSFSESRLSSVRPTRPSLTTSFSSFSSLSASLRSGMNKSKRFSWRQTSSDSVSTFRSHMSSPSMSSLSPSVYATSSILPQPFQEDKMALQQPSATIFHEGHELQRVVLDPLQSITCDASMKPIEGSILRCTGCQLNLSDAAARLPVPPCPASFDALKTRLAFLRAMTALLSDYRKYMEPVVRDGRIQYTHRQHTEPGFLGQVMQTSAWHEFIHDACTRPNDEDVLLFTHILMVRNKNAFGKRSGDAWLLTRQDSPRRVFQVVPPNAEGVEAVTRSRVPDYLDTALFSIPRVARPTSHGTRTNSVK